MPLNTKIVYEDGRYPFNAGAAFEPGDVIIRPCGTLAVLDGMYGVASGELINPAPLVPTKIVELTAATADTWAAGAVLYWDNVNKRLTTTASGNKRVGNAIAAKTSGQLSALVNCTEA